MTSACTAIQFDTVAPASRRGNPISINAWLRAPAVARSVLVLALLQPTELYGKELFNKARIVGADRLEAMRGGFIAANGVEFSFGIDRAVYVNGQLVATTQLVLGNLERLLQGGIPLVRVLGGTQIVQAGANNSVTVGDLRDTATLAGSGASSAAGAAGSAPGAASGVPLVGGTPAAQWSPVGAPVATMLPSPASPPSPPLQAPTAGPPTLNTQGVPAASTAPMAQAAPIQPAPGSTAAAGAMPVTPGATPIAVAAPVPPPAAAPAQTAAVAIPPAQAPASGTAIAAAPTTAFVVQTAAGPQTVIVPNTQAMVTAIQNSMNNQLIQTRTQIDATLSSLAAFRAASFAQAMEMTRGRP